MKKKLLIRLIALLIWLSLVIGIQPGLAQSGGDETSRLFLPLISRMVEPVWLGPESADVVTIAYDRRVEDRIYLGTWGAGVFVSEDGGLSWKRRSNGLENLYIQRLAVDPQQGGVVYAGTYGSGIYKTSDGGWNWYPINQGLMNGAIVYGLAVDPQQTNRVYASARVANRSQPPWGGVVYRSQDGGLTWEAVLQDIGGSAEQDWVYSLAVDPQNPQRVLAASHEHGIYRSLDYGGRWAAANNGITDLSGRAVVFDPRGSTAYFGVWHRTGEFKTLTGGDSWILQQKGLEGAKIYDLTVNPLNPNQLLAATFMMNYSETERGVARSDNAGQMWVRSGLQPYFIYTVAVNPFNGNEVLAGTVDYGVFRSTDGGKNWTASNRGLINATVTDLLVDPLTPQVWYAAVQGRGVWRSMDGGSHWEELSDGLGKAAVYALARDAENPQRMLAWTSAGWLALQSGESRWQAVEMQAAGLKRLVDRPFSVWRKPPPPKPGFEVQADEIEPIELSSLWPALAETAYPPEESLPGLKIFSVLQTSQGNWLAGTSDGIYRHDEEGGWQPSGLRGQAGIALAVDPLNNEMMAAAASSQVWLSRDGGDTWKPYTAEFPLTNIQGLWFDGQGDLLVSLSGQGLLRLGLP